MKESITETKAMVLLYKIKFVYNKQWRKATVFFTQRMMEIFMNLFITFNADNNVRSMAIDLQKTALLTRIDGGDFTALETKYHLSRLTTLRNRHLSFLRQSESSSSDEEEGKIEARDFVELITQIENSIEIGTFCFKFSALRQIYESCLHNFCITKTRRFKDRVLNYFPMLKNKVMERTSYLCLNKESNK